MNGDPYRTPQPADRRVINRSGQQAYQRTEEAPIVKEEAPKATPRSSASHSKAPEKRSKKGILWAIIAIIVILGLLIGGWLVWSNANKNTETGIDSSRYQAVFLSGGLIYFGKLHAYNDEYLKLTNGYFPQTQAEDATATANASSQQNGIQLIRLGDEVYGPESEIFISKKQVLHYENLRTDSKVAQLIEQNEKTK